MPDGRHGRTCLEEPWLTSREQFLSRKDEARGRL